MPKTKPLDKWDIIYWLLMLIALIGLIIYLKGS